jgi:glycosyltransferase involved in cell wall biosynthesis
VSDGFKVAALRADNSGCAFYRIKEPVRAVSEQYPEIEITVGTSIDVVGYKNRNTNATTVEHVNTDADLIIIQRPLAQWFTPMIEQAQRQGIAVIVELDDDFENVHQKNLVWSNVQPHFHPMSNYDWLKKSCELADHVTVSTEALRKYAPHDRVSVLPNYIARRNVGIQPLQPRNGQPVRIGWSGTIQTHPTDLQVTKPGINQVLRDTKSELVIVGDGVGVRDALGVAKSITMTPTGWVDTDDYMETLCGAMDVGIVPLDNTAFNAAKSHLKGLEFAACGIPFVASPLPEYAALAAQGIGEVASTPSDWRRLVGRWVNNEQLRVATGEAYQSLVREKFVLENHAGLWVDAWRAAITYRKNRGSQS